MGLPKIHQSLIKITKAYEDKLNEISEDDFVATPLNGGWSFSEVYSHIFDSSLLSLVALANCVNGEGEKKPTLFAVKLILWMGMLPPGRKYKVPKRLADRVKKINIMAAKQLLLDFGLQLTKIYPTVKLANPEVKTQHPRLGYLNAKQWLRFIEIHLKHHLKQLQRIEKMKDI